MFFGLLGAAVGSTTSADAAIFELDTDNGEIILKEHIQKKK
jgi:hypothetical protein